MPNLLKSYLEKMNKNIIQGESKKSDSFEMQISRTEFRQFDTKLLIVLRYMSKARFGRRIFVASNAVQTVYNDMTYGIIYGLSCIRRDEGATSKTA